MKKHLIIISTPPYQGLLAKEALDCALVLSTFGAPVTLLFMGKGIFQLLEDQDGKQLEQPTLGKQLSALPLYDIHDIYLEQATLSETTISAENLVTPVKTADSRCIAELISDADIILRF